MSASTSRPLTFAEVQLQDLDALTEEQTDALPFGVVGFDAENIVELYNSAESRLAGLPKSSVVGTHYFSSTAQCMNNFLIAQRFEDEAQLDVTLDYVLTLRMRPTPVRLRLLKAPTIARRYILIER